MSEGCNHDCGNCTQNCPSRQMKPEDFLESPHEMSSIRKVIGVVSGKGGVGKSLVTSLMAVLLNRRGYNTAILDADITGPSIPKAFGIHNESGIGVSPDGNLMLPAKSLEGVDIMSANLLLDNDTDPVIWRGPVIAGAVKQFWSETLWQDGQQDQDHSGRESEQYRQKEEQEKMQKAENTRFLQELRLGLIG